MQMKIQNTLTAPVFALHSSASSNGQWKQLKQELEGKYDVITPNLPGYGLTSLEQDFTLEGVASIAAPVIKEIQKYGTGVHIVGHSNGGGVALKVALMRPDLVKSLTLYEPATFHFLKSGTFEDKNLFAEIAQVSGLLTASVASDRPDLGMKQFIDFWNGNDSWEKLPLDLQAKLTGYATMVMSDFANGFSETWPLAQLQQLNIPTLMMIGMESPSVAQHAAVSIAHSIPGARLALLPGLGHMAPVFQSKWINPRIQEHIAKIERAATSLSWPHRSAA
jgi:pimeloyl-ACP methyl ester carboxylesterase